MRTGLDMEKGEEGRPGGTASQNFWALVQLMMASIPSLPGMPEEESGARPGSLGQGLSTQLREPEAAGGEGRAAPKNSPTRAMMRATT